MTVEVTHGPFSATAHQIPRRDADPDAPERWIVNVHRVSDGRHMHGQKWLTRAPSLLELGTILREWIYEKAGAVEPDKVFCAAKCGTELVPEANMDTDYQFDNALWVAFNGGYGMFIDPFDSEPPKAVLCHDCAHALCEQHPWINDLLNPHGSHSHKTPYVEAHPDHFGWDYDHRAEKEAEREDGSCPRGEID